MLSRVAGSVYWLFRYLERAENIARFINADLHQFLEDQGRQGNLWVSLLAVTFKPNIGEDPGGVIEIVLAGGGAIRLTVECIDAELTDMTGPWAARGTPDHEAESA